MEMTDVVTRVQGKPITVRDAVNHLKVTGTFRNAILRLIEMEVVRLRAESHGLNGDCEAFQEYLDRRRRVLGLVDALTVDRFCRWHGIRWEEWKQTMLHDWFCERLKEQLAAPEAVEAFFQAHRLEFRKMFLAQAAFSTEAEARRALEALRAGETTFAAVALSLERLTGIAGGYLGCYQYGMLPREVESPLLQAEAGAVVGPFAQNGRWFLYHVVEVRDPEWNDPLRGQIRERIFTHWLRQEVQNARV
ncbi:MAG: peptidyl-prolyl cis-trans isomerase [Magnetococcales bacterium]|nr:peptidyl-prolyl cis-trans isomerase [Magnetococcales bacterium]